MSLFQRLTIILCSLLIISYCPLKSQEDSDRRLDSLHHVLRSSKADTNKVKTLIQMCILKDNTFQTDSIKYYAKEALELATTLGYHHGMGNAHRSMGIAHWGNGDLDSAMIECNKAIEQFDLISDSARLASITFLQGMVYGDQGRYDEALENYFEALDYFEKAAEFGRCGIILNSLGIAQKDIGEFDQAEKSFLRSLELLGEQGSDLSKANTMSNLGDLYLQTGRLDEAYDKFKEVLEIDRRLGIDWGIGFQLSNLGNILLQKQEYAEALDNQLQALEIRRKLGHKVHLTSNLMMVGLTHLEAGDPEFAIPYYEEAQEIATEINGRDYLRDIHENLGRCHAALGQFEEAYSHSLSASILQDSIYQKDTSDKIQELTARYETDKKDAALALLSTENEIKDVALRNQRTIKWALVLGLALLTMIGFLVFRGMRMKHRNAQLIIAKNAELRETEFKRNLTELELKALRAQMNPHFIFNCMNSINRLILEDRNEQASRNLTKFSKLIRMILDHSEKKTVKLGDELEMLKTYIDLEAQRFKGKISYDIRVSDTLDRDDIEIPSMILQPYIENAIWHGLMHKKDEEGHIDIQIEERGDQLLCSIEDNGVGREKALEMKSKSSIKHKSMAMKVTEARLALLDKTGLGKLIEIIDLKDAGQAIGTRVVLSIPI